MNGIAQLPHEVSSLDATRRAQIKAYIDNKIQVALQQYLPNCRLVSSSIGWHGTEVGTPGQPVHPTTILVYNWTISPENCANKQDVYFLMNDLVMRYGKEALSAATSGNLPTSAENINWTVIGISLGAILLIYLLLR